MTNREAEHREMFAKILDEEPLLHPFATLLRNNVETPLCRKALSAMSAAADAAEKRVRGWQPIETAPKDGTRMLVLIDNYACIYRWSDGIWSGVIDKIIDSDSGHLPTHWAPFPSPLDIAPSPSPEGWIAHDGGECPVAIGTMVDVKLRAASAFGEIPARPFGWVHSGGPFDVLYYRPPASENPTPPDAAMPKVDDWRRVPVTAGMLADLFDATRSDVWENGRQDLMEDVRSLARRAQKKE